MDFLSSINEEGILHNLKLEQENSVSRIELIKKRYLSKKPKFNKKISGKDFKINCHAIGAIMTDPKGGDNRKRYDRALELKEQTELAIQKLKDGIAQKVEAMSSMNPKTKGYIKEAKVLENKKESKKQKEAQLLSITSEVAMLFKEKEKVRLSATAISYLRMWMKKQMTGRTKVFFADQLVKGIENEDESIEIYNELFGTTGKKNDKRYYSDWATGEFDFRPSEDGIELNEIHDMKNSSDLFTFPLFKKTAPEVKEKDKKIQKSYYDQLNGYGHLLIENGLVKKEGLKLKLNYALTSSSEHLILRKLKKAAYNLGRELTEIEEEQIFSSMWFENIPKEYRMKVFIFEPDFDYIEKIKTRVEDCRKWIDQEIKSHSMIIQL